MARIDFGGVVEEVVNLREFPLSRAQSVLKDELVAVLGYGVQGQGQSLNMRDNGISVIVGQRPGTPSWEKALTRIIHQGPSHWGLAPPSPQYPSRFSVKNPDRYLIQTKKVFSSMDEFLLLHHQDSPHYSLLVNNAG